MSTRRSTQEKLAAAIGMDGFILLNISQTLTNLEGEWRFQLMVDRKGDGVDFFNSTLIWQAIDSSEMAHNSGSKGLCSLSQSVNLRFDKKECIVSQRGISSSTGMGGGGLFFYAIGRREWHCR